jgi:5-methylcytosine-specific restriction endonuclease McrA
MNKRTQATNISAKVRRAVMERDSCCIFCGSYQMLSLAHYVPRSKGGLGIEQNLAVVCIPCHSRLDQSINRKATLEIFRIYLEILYGQFDDSDLQYKKGETQ